VRQAHPEQTVVYVEDRSALAGSLVGQLQSGDLCLTLGAGDITALADELLPLLGEGGAA
jgi:UDP-N-acetylmuramate--alanine ligase